MGHKNQVRIYLELEVQSVRAIEEFAARGIDRNCLFEDTVDEDVEFVDRDLRWSGDSHPNGDASIGACSNRLAW